MKISARTLYAIKALTHMASVYPKPCQIKTLALKTKISCKYLEQIFAMLKVHGLVFSKRGPMGGYQLLYKPEHITLDKIFVITEGRLIVPAEYDMKDETNESLFQLYSKVTGTIVDMLQKITLKELTAVCPCCKRKIKVQHYHLMNGIACEDCYMTWFDEGITNPKRIGELTLERLKKC